MHAHLVAARRFLDDALDGIDPAEAALRPAEGKWCLAEVVEHLALASRAP